jgi:hypothetical protein
LAYVSVDGIMQRRGFFTMSALRETPMTVLSQPHVALIVSVLALPAFGTAAVAETCVTKAGSATGITRGFAEYEAFLIIRQVTGNWPFQTDRIGAPTYKCSQDGVLWTCHAQTIVCSK